MGPRRQLDRGERAGDARQCGRPHRLSLPCARSAPRAGPVKDGKPVRFRVLIDGKPPGDDRGVDVDDKGEGVIKEQRLYQLLRQRGEITDRTFEIEFLDPGVQAFAFTFG